MRRSSCGKAEKRAIFMAVGSGSDGSSSPTVTNSTSTGPLFQVISRNRNENGAELKRENEEKAGGKKEWRCFVNY
jgi:hypothetical protein